MPLKEWLSSWKEDNMTDLKPCPFCGGESEIETEECSGYDVVCKTNDCFMDKGGGGIFDTEQEAIKAWNTRYVAQRADKNLWRIGDELIEVES